MPPLPAPIAERVARYRVAMVAAQPDIAESLLRRAALDLWKSAKVADTMHPPEEAATFGGVSPMRSPTSA